METFRKFFIGLIACLGIYGVYVGGFFVYVLLAALAIYAGVELIFWWRSNRSGEKKMSE